MRISTFFYTLKQGIINIFRNKWFSLASIATISASLFILGLFYAVILNFQNIVHTAEEGVSVTIFFQEGTTEERMKGGLTAITMIMAVQWKDFSRMRFA